MLVIDGGSILALKDTGVYLQTLERFLVSAELIGERSLGPRNHLQRANGDDQPADAEAPFDRRVLRAVFRVWRRRRARWCRDTCCGGGGARTNNVRSNSVNSVNSNGNVNRNTNINASREVIIDVDNNGCCHNGWDNDYHPVAAAAATTATAAIIGSMVRTVPVNYGGVVYQQCGSTCYQPQGGQYVVINPPY